MLRRLALLVLVIACPVLAYAQTGTPADNCIPGAPPFSTFSGRPYTITWLQDPTTAATNPDGTISQAAYFIDGFTYQVSNGTTLVVPKTEIVPKPLPQTQYICPAGTPNAGKIPYGFTVSVGVPKGQYTVTLCVWNFKRTVDPATGAVTVLTEKQEACQNPIPFVVNDLANVYVGPPAKPVNVKVIR